MDGQQDANAPTNEPEEQASFQLPVKPAVTETEITGDDGAKSQENKSTTTELAREFRWFEGLSLIINGVLALVGIGALLIYSGQLSVMQGTLAEMKRSGQAASDQVWQAIGNINWLAREMNYARDQAMVASSNSERAAKKALDGSITASRNDQRAWVGVRSASATTMEVGKEITVEVMFSNTGKTPALEFVGVAQFSANIKPYDIQQAIRDRPSVDQAKMSHTILFPDAIHSIRVVSPIVLTDKWSAEIKAKTWDVRILGEAQYKDVFGRSHKTTFCQYYAPAENRFLDCNTYNTAN